MANKTALYAQIDEDVKNRASLYVTQAKLLKKEVNTLGELIENALDEYMINHPL